MTAPDPSIELMRLINGYQVSQALHVAAMLLVSQINWTEVLRDRGAGCGAHPTSLYRLLRAPAAIGVFREGDNKGFYRAQPTDLAVQHPTSSSWSSTSRPPRRSASPCRDHSSSTPTR
jgi:hypothetical protein